MSNNWSPKVELTPSAVSLAAEPRREEICPSTFCLLSQDQLYYGDICGDSWQRESHVRERESVLLPIPGPRTAVRATPDADWLRLTGIALWI